MTLKHVQRGQPLNIAASDWNRIVDATRAHYENLGSTTNAPATAGSKQASVILVRNDSGQDQERFAVLGIDAPVILPGDNLDEFKRQVTFSCITPTTADHSQRFVILLEPVRSGGIGRAVIAGVAICQVAMVSADDTTAGIVDGDTTHLVSGQPGAQILWSSSTAGGAADWAIVRLGTGGGASVTTTFWARLTGSSSSGSNRWSYTFVEVEYQKQGTWQVLTGGRTGTAYNSMEESNTAAGVQGDGTDASNYPSGVTLKPLGTAVVQMYEVTNCETGDPEYVFAAPNNPDGPCAS